MRSRRLPPILLTLAVLILGMILGVVEAEAADNMCNVDRKCETPQDWERGWGDARSPENAGAVPVLFFNASLNAILPTEIASPFTSTDHPPIG